MSEPSVALARFIAQSRWEEVPAAIRKEARRAFLNMIGCTLGGRSEPALQLLAATFPACDATSAAVLNAASATALDFDDTHLPTVIHPGPPVGGTVLSLLRETQASGSEALHAFLVGVEVACRIGNAVTPGHYERGWHITSTCGVFGAAAAASRLLRLDEAKTKVALALAATQAAGLVEVFGSMARVLNAGFAARNGIVSARLAASGFDGPERPIEGTRGFVNVFGGNSDYSAITGQLGERWELAQVAYKPYPCGVVLHAMIDACLELRTPSLPERVEVTLHPLAIERTDRPAPRDAAEARLSAQHCAAVALLRGRVGVGEFTDAVVSDPEVRRLGERVRIVADDRLDKAAATVKLHAADGSVLSVHAPPRIAMSDAELEAKFRSLAGPRAEEWMRLVDALESLERVVLPKD